MVVRTSFSYSQWGDLLTAYKGQTITYDSIGNPLSYYNGSSYTFTWEGRRLVSAVKGSKTMSFEYNDEGIRTSKTVNGVKHTYYLNGSQIVAEQWSDKLIVYLYDATGAPIGMMYRTTAYAEEQWDVFWFEKNLQGDIVAVYNSDGAKVVTYTYSDAWGNHTATYHNGSISTGVQYNPFRYRGYYYDTDLGLYYLQSRYYDAKICRFINADGYVSTGQGLTGNNMFAYCGNNPVNRVDPTGESSIGIFFLVVLGGVLLCVLTSCSSNDADSINNIAHEIDYNEKRIEVTIDISNMPDSNDFLIRYTDALADEIENSEKGKEFLNGEKINRAKLYAEIKAHAVCWDKYILRKRANPAEIYIYADGSVEDPRDWLDKLMFDLYGGEYE